MRNIAGATILLVALLTGCGRQHETATRPAGPEGPQGPELVVIGPVITLDAARPRATGLVVRSGLIARVTTASRALEEVGRDTRVLRVPRGGAVLPGIIESHAHFTSIGRTERILDLTGTTSARDVADRVRRRAGSTAEGRWIVGRGWNQEHWPKKRFPDRSVLDEAAPAHPVALTRVDGHALWANGIALDAAGIGPSTPSPAGGEIVRDASGRATGVLVDRAMGLVTRLIEDADAEQVADDALAAQRRALAFGITTLVDAGSSRGTIRTLRRLYEEGRLVLRLYVMRSASGGTMRRVLDLPILEGLYDDRLTVRAVKMYADGALGSRGAWLLEPYADRPGHVGLPVESPAHLVEAAGLARRKGYQLCVHAIGDRANREVLDAFEDGLGGAAAAARLDHRFRVEHAQILDAADIPRFRLLGVLPSMQACHATSDGPWVPDRIGAGRTAEGAYAWRKLIDTGTVIPNGTDAPVEPLSPWINLHASVYRGPADGSAPPFTPDQRMNRLEALLSLTAWGAYGVFAEDRRGRLRAGFQADVIVVDRDPLTCPVHDLADTRVLATIVAGRVVHEAAP